MDLSQTIGQIEAMGISLDDLKMFQSLIGRLKTIGILKLSFFLHFVSIPYR